MEWLTDQQAAELPKLWVARFQLLALNANLDQLTADIPVAPTVAPPNGLPSPTLEWNGLLGTRRIFIETQPRFSKAAIDSIVSHTTFDEGSEDGDWRVLEELGSLPRSIFISSPVCVQSRAFPGTDVVYRPSDNGWRDPIYRAHSREDAGAFLRFLRNDPANDACYIGNPDLEGNWTILRVQSDREERIGNYPNSASAFALASSESKGDRPGRVVVRHFPHGMKPLDFKVVDGRVV
jgi:hypothetical protein